ncbi:hypothetical protein CNYM01_09845 [Colletotrichum nymphaeae SA-01]|uniref:Uncharacterized protein n=1 Tax=Colletotrichum nymphaeae SA-01 TaxID=1460502 RepID=A0A135T0H2_9PEZI|nr:hypothetical protein CNYM01_09845 [Colletotrichum nymphaeae SA-01]
MASSAAMNSDGCFYPVLNMKFGTIYLLNPKPHTPEMTLLIAHFHQEGLLSVDKENAFEQERLASIAIKKSGIDRRRLFVAIKVHAPVLSEIESHDTPQYFTYMNLLEDPFTALRESQERLQIEYVDLNTAHAKFAISILLHDAHVVIRDVRDFSTAWKHLKLMQSNWETSMKGELQLREQAENPTPRARFIGISNFEVDKEEIFIEIPSQALFLESQYPQFRRFRRGRDLEAYLNSAWLAENKLREVNKIRAMFPHRTKLLESLIGERGITRTDSFMCLEPIPDKTLPHLNFKYDMGEDVVHEGENCDQEMNDK